MGGQELRAILGNNLKSYRSHRKWSQADLAEQADISVTFLSDIERGNKWPYPDTISNLASALDIEVHELFLDEEKASHTPADAAVKELMRRFVKDVSLTLNKSVSLSLNQSLEHLRRQYFPE